MTILLMCSYKHSCLQIFTCMHCCLMICCLFTFLCAFLIKNILHAFLWPFLLVHFLDLQAFFIANFHLHALLTYDLLLVVEMCLFTFQCAFLPKDILHACLWEFLLVHLLVNFHLYALLSYVLFLIVEMCLFTLLYAFLLEDILCAFPWAFLLVHLLDSSMCSCEHFCLWIFTCMFCCLIIWSLLLKCTYLHTCVRLDTMIMKHCHEGTMDFCCWRFVILVA